ncbi:MAG: alpha/beta fold hydrolase, partial [Desulfobacterales bacterium]
MTEKKKTIDRSRKRGNVSKKKQPLSDDGSLLQARNKQGGYALNDDLVEQALISGEYRDLLEIYFGEDLYDELRGLTTRARTARTRGGPRVLVLPGIMGSKLGKQGVIFDDTIWLDPVEVIAGGIESLSLINGDQGITALGVLLTVYLKIKLRLKLAGFDTDFHPFDWRQNIAEEGARLADRIRRETSSQHSEIYLVAHSMGGLIARSAVKFLEGTGEDDKVRRLIMLGTPNYGSFSPVQAFSGYHSMVKKVAALDLRHSEEELVNEVFNTFVGLYQMLPAPQKFTGLDIYKPANWPSTGIAPRPEILSSAADIHKHLAPGRDRFTLIAGINQDTIVDVHRELEQFVFIASKEGDGTVPLSFAELEDATTYYVEEQHGSLPNNADVIRAVIDLLETGRTENLPTSWTPQRLGQRRTVRGDELARIPFDERTGKNISPRELRHLLDEFAAPSKPVRDELQPSVMVRPEGISSEPIVVGRKRQQRLDLRIAHGDITQVDTRAVVLGLFKGVIPSGAAAAIDRQLDGVITDFTERRILSANIGEVFIMPTNRYRMGADIVVFAGLGTYDDFNEEVLRLVAENIARTLLRTKVDDFATVLLSSGSGMATADVLSNLVDGFLRGLQEGGQDGHLRAITLCENNKSRFDQMHQELLRLTTTSIFDNIETTLEIQELPPVYPSS